MLKLHSGMATPPRLCESCICCPSLSVLGIIRCFFLILAMLIGTQLYVIVALIYISLVTNEVWHLFVWLLVNHISCWERAQVSCLFLKLDCIFFYFWVLKFFIYLGCQCLVKYVTSKYSLQICVLSLHSLNDVFGREKFPILIQSYLSFFKLCSDLTFKSFLPYLLF